MTFVNFTAKNAMSARYVLERADWADAAALPFTSSQYPQPDSLIRFTRGLGMARTGDLAGAKAEIEAIKALRAALEKSNQSYWADRSEEQMLAISAWVALKEGARDQALQFMRAAADGEDGSVKHVAMENRLYPLRELFAELLLETGQPAAALSEFEAGSTRPPTVTARSWELPVPQMLQAIARRHPSTMASSWTWPKTPTPTGRTSGRRRISWHRDNDGNAHQ